MDSINWVIQLFEYEQLSTLFKLIERMRQIFVNATLKSLLIYMKESIFSKSASYKSATFLDI